MKPGENGLSFMYLMAKLGFIVLALLTCVATLVWSAIAWASGNGADEGSLKTAYLYNFAKYIEWPDEERSTLRLCLIGDGKIGESIDKLIGKPVRHMTVGVRHALPLQDIPQCDLVFVAAERAEVLERVRQIVNGYPIVIVTESIGPLPRGAMVVLIVSDSRIVFEIDWTTMRQSGLTVSGKLLQLARKVY